MNFWHDRSLKVWALVLTSSLSLIFIVEFFVVRRLIDGLADAERKIDFVRSTQVASQKTALHVAHFLQGDRTIDASIAASLEEVDDLVNTIGGGGRLGGSDIMFGSLGRLPRITFDNLHQSWQRYRAAVLTVITSGEVVPYDINAFGQTNGDSTVVLTNMGEMRSALSGARVTVQSHWITLSRWFDRLIDDLEGEIVHRQQAVINWFAFFIVVDIAAMIFLFMLFRRRVLDKLTLLGANAGNQVHTLDLPSDEIGDVATQINGTIEYLRDATDFVIAIGDGKLDLEYQTLDPDYSPGQNRLADSLIEMQSRLRSLGVEEKKRQWSNEGLTKFADILRSSNDNVNLLCDKIISALVQYTQSNQGGLYLLNDENEHDKHLELISLFAFDIKKYETQKIKLGEGILGQAFIEKETTYLTSIPDDFVRITSGLGDSRPKAVLMVPLKLDREVYGIIELASFHEFQQHVIAFVEKLGESIASTLGAVRAAQRNKRLIEQFQQQTEQMRAQEEEMRQNMEELQATQEEVARKEQAYVERIAELEGKLAQEPEQVRADKLASARKEREYEERIKGLMEQIDRKPAQGDDWATAVEVEKALRINLEALQITQAALDSKPDH
jgi:methyl-accepting chemotaxis protein